jgi:hypothetical protein
MTNDCGSMLDATVRRGPNTGRMKYLVSVAEAWSSCKRRMLQWPSSLGNDGAGRGSTDGISNGRNVGLEIRGRKVGECVGDGIMFKVDLLVLVSSVLAMFVMRLCETL